MIVVHLSGGLGNQLFQYAAGRALSARTRSRLKVDLSTLGDNSLRGYRLNCFGIQAAGVSKLLVNWLRRLNQPTTGGAVARVIQNILPFYSWEVVCEKHYHFDPTFLEHVGNVYMLGYWQSAKYFEEIQHLIRSELTLANTRDKIDQEMQLLIADKKSVSLHIRRGDYVSDPGINRVHGLLPVEYYQNAVSYLKSKLGNIHVFVFSDDLDWVEQKFHVDAPFTLVRNRGKDRDFMDLILMSQCKHHVLANSSFSWWGAWLNADSEKVVIAPQKWFNDPSLDTRDLLPEKWVRI